MSKNIKKSEFKKSNWKRFKKTTCSINKINLKKEIKIEKNEKIGLSASKINSYLANLPNFLGCYAQDQLINITFKSLPVFFVVNFDPSYAQGSHWVAIRVSKKSVEVYDTLGFDVRKWPSVPKFLLYFLHKFTSHRKLYLLKNIQSQSSTLCGFYCIFFIIFRSTNNFKSCNNVFTSNLNLNDEILYDMIDQL